MAFRERLAYDRKTGLRTPKTAIPFKLLGDIDILKNELARLEGETSNALFETLEDWNEHLKQAGIDLEEMSDG